MMRSIFGKGFCFSGLFIGMGFFDWFTTLIAIWVFGAKEVNPLLSGVAESNLFLFSLVKFFAIGFAGFAFYRAGAMRGMVKHFSLSASWFVDIGYIISLLSLTGFVTNNVFAICCSI